MTYVDDVLNAMTQELPNLDPELTRLYALLVLLAGERVSCEDVHDAWAIWQSTTDPGHRSIVPFDELAKDVQDLDILYRDAIIRVAVNMRPGSVS